MRQRWGGATRQRRRPLLPGFAGLLAAMLCFACLVPGVWAAPLLQAGPDSDAGRRLRRTGEPEIAAAPAAPAVVPSQDGWNYHYYLPSVARQGACPTGSSHAYALLAVEGATTDRPAELHGDLNLALRGYAWVDEAPRFVGYNGDTDSDPPRLKTLYGGVGEATFVRTYRVYDWDWSCGPDGCRSSDFAPTYPVTLLGLRTAPGQPVYLPARSQRVGNGFMAIVLYAAERRITLKYTPEDNVVRGYTVHLEDVCIDPNLLRLYRTYQDGPLRPGLDLSQPLGLAPGEEIKVAVRDVGTFLDPRSAKDWWQDWP